MCSMAESLRQHFIAAPSRDKIGTEDRGLGHRRPRPAFGNGRREADHEQM